MSTLFVGNIDTVQQKPNHVWENNTFFFCFSTAALCFLTLYFQSLCCQFAVVFGIINLIQKLQLSDKWPHITEEFLVDFLLQNKSEASPNHGLKSDFFRTYF